jgi:hypothetical protein
VIVQPDQPTDEQRRKLYQEEAGGFSADPELGRDRYTATAE